MSEDKNKQGTQRPQQPQQPIHEESELRHSYERTTTTSQKPSPGHKK